MPIHDLGYRAWQGERRGGALRWLVIAQNGFQRAWKNYWLRRLIFLAWIPAFYFGAIVFFYERALTAVEEGQVQDLQLLRMAVGVAPPSFRPYLTKAMEMEPQESRHFVWSLLLLTFFRYPQGTSLVLVVGLVAPPLIARDVGSKAFLLYFSRPISRLEYILGKMAAVWGYLLLITTAPALALYALAVSLSPSIAVVAFTWDLPLRVLAATVVLLVPTTALALAFSSLTRHVVSAGFLWYAVWVLGFMAEFILTSVDERQRLAGATIDENRWALVSPYHMLGQVQEYIFEFSEASPIVVWCAATLALITVVSLLLLFWRVSSPMRV